jgi:mono/diheme cytochrome c family protein
LFLQAAHDPHPRVRLETIVAASWLDNPDGARIALEALRHPFDRWMGPVFNSIMSDTLKDDVEALRAGGQLTLADHPRARDYLSGQLVFSTPASGKDEKFGPTRELGEADQKIYERGREVFHRDGHCATCHQPNGLGLPNAYPPLTKSPWIEENERMIKIVLKGLWGPMEFNGTEFDPEKGIPPMPGFAPLLKDEEVAAVINYVRNSFGNTAPFLTPADIAPVRQRTDHRQDYYMVEELMREHPIPGWEQWKKAPALLEGFE